MLLTVHFCLVDVTGGINDSEVNQHVSMMAANQSVTRFYTSLNDNVTEGEWRHVDVPLASDAPITWSNTGKHNHSLGLQLWGIIAICCATVIDGG